MEENTPQTNQPIQPTLPNQEGLVQQTPVQGQPLPPLRVGVICTETNQDDLEEYRPEFIAINQKLGGRVELVFMGHTGHGVKNNWSEGINYEFVKPTSIVHYFKQLDKLNLDVLFIPLLKNKYNVTSEDYAKFLEAGLFQIPIVAVGIYPYQKIIQDKVNGFTFKEKHELVPLLDHLHIQRKLVHDVGRNAYHDVTTQFNYSPEHIKLVSDLFVKTPTNE